MHLSEESTASLINISAENKINLSSFKDNFYELFEYFSPKTNYEGIDGFTKLTGIKEPLGGGNIYYNSIVTAVQVIKVIALVDDPLVRSIRDNQEINHTKFIDLLVRSQILQRFRILDYGCGPKPVAARIFRALGAEVWTVDIIGTESFFGKVSKKEIKNHIRVRGSPEDIYFIKEKTSKGFDIVTSACLEADGGNLQYQDIYKLLSDDGVYVKMPPKNDQDVITKEEIRDHFTVF